MNNKQYMILNDLDGVYFDWQNKFLDIINFDDEINAHIRANCSKPWMFKDIDTFNKHPNRVWIRNLVYASYPNYFLEIPVLENAKQLLRQQFWVWSCRERLGKDINIGVLTATGSSDYRIHNKIGKQKLKSFLDLVDSVIRENALVDERTLSQFLKHIESNFYVVVNSEDKVEYAKRWRTLLIDDYQKNCIEFTAAGGRAVCVGETAYRSPVEVVKEGKLTVEVQHFHLPSKIEKAIAQTELFLGVN